MPPCIWMLSSATSVPMRPMLYLAADSARSRDDAFGVERRGGVDHRGARLLDLEQQVGHAVLQRLEAADQRAELLAGAQVFERRVLRLVHRAERFGAERDDAGADRVSPASRSRCPWRPSSASAGSFTSCSVTSAARPPSIVG